MSGHYNLDAAEGGRAEPGNRRRSSYPAGSVHRGEGGERQSSSNLLALGRLVTASNAELLVSAMGSPLEAHDIEADRPGKLLLRYWSAEDQISWQITDSAAYLRKLWKEGSADYQNLSMSDVACHVAGVALMSSRRQVPDQTSFVKLGMVIEANDPDEQQGLYAERLRVRGKKLDPGDQSLPPPLLVATILMSARPEQADAILADAQTVYDSLPPINVTLGLLGTLPSVERIPLTASQA